ncbi:MAG: diguanylate cyclase [Campylobacterota bacterium]|nr:diguanylate cyclase [Campylobacterota bacterium]
MKILLVLFLSHSLGAHQLEKVSLQLQWLDQFQFAGYYVAKEKGFYEDVGLEVEIKKFNYKTSTTDEVLNKKTTYSVGRLSLIIDKSNGKNIVLLASIFQSSPSVLVATKDSNINSVKDFQNKKIMLTDDIMITAALQAMANKNNISLENMIKMEHSLDIKDLINKKTDLMAIYISNEPYILREKGIEYTIFDPKDYGFDFYSDFLFTSNEEVQNHRERTINFKNASLKGWEYAFSHMQESVDIILKKYNSQNKTKEALLFEAQTLKKLAYHKNTKLGNIEISKLKRIYDVYNLLNFVQNEIDFNKFVLFERDPLDFHPSNSEKEYLKNKKELRVCSNPKWMPLEQITDGELIGISADYLKIIESKIDIPITLIQTENLEQSLDYFKKQKCDILSIFASTPKRKAYMNLTTPYLSTPLVIATTADKFFISNIEEILDKKLGITKDCSFCETLKLKYPNINLVEVNSTKEGLQEVENGNLYGYLNNLNVIGYQIQKNNFYSLKIAGKFEENWKLGISVQKDDEILLEILNKAINSIDDKTQNSIISRWSSIKYDYGFDYRLFWQILYVIGFIVLALLYRHYEIKKHNKRLLLLNKKLEQLSTTDTLTKIYNRRYLDSRMNESFELYKRYQTPFSLILIDIDDFKLINDTYGHQIGDSVLQTISQTISKDLRKNDVLGRWGGEEFLIILHHTKINEAQKIAQKICLAIEEASYGIEKTITASFGVTEVTKDDLAINLITRVDKALYKAKDEGKNRVVTIL